VFLRDLVIALDAHGVRYAIVGGVAVNLHGIPRMTYDVDIVVDMTEENLMACEAALREVRLRPRLPIALCSLTDTDERTRLERERNLVAVTFTDSNDPLREVDILVAPWLDPEGIVERSIPCPLGDRELRVARLDDLIELKRRAGRAQDLADLTHLERRRFAHGNR
jgi:hypothetical protein